MEFGKLTLQLTFSQPIVGQTPTLKTSICDLLLFHRLSLACAKTLPTNVVCWAEFLFEFGIRIFNITNKVTRIKNNHTPSIIKELKQ